MKLMKMASQDSFWQLPQLHNCCYVLGYESLDLSDEISLLLRSGQAGSEPPWHMVLFWRGSDSCDRIEQFIAAEPPRDDVVIWDVSIPWLYLWIWIRRNHLTEVIGSLSSEQDFVRYSPEEALQVLQTLHQATRIWAHNLVNAGGAIPKAGLCQDELVCRNFVLRQFSPDAMGRIFDVMFECPKCHSAVELPETIYLGWRCGDLKCVPCNNCGADIRDAKWARAKCPRCARLTQLLPDSIADAVNIGRIPQFECSECILAAAKNGTRLLPSTSSLSAEVVPTSNSGSSGCVPVILVFVLTVTISLL